MADEYDPLYRLRRNGYEIDGCERCDSEAPTCILRTVAVMDRSMSPAQEKPRPVRLCPWCSETELGTILQYPAQHMGQQTLVRGLCQALNIIAPGGKVPQK